MHFNNVGIASFALFSFGKLGIAVPISSTVAPVASSGFPVQNMTVDAPSSRPLLTPDENMIEPRTTWNNAFTEAARDYCEHLVSAVHYSTFRLSDCDEAYFATLWRHLRSGATLDQMANDMAKTIMLKHHMPMSAAQLTQLILDVNKQYNRDLKRKEVLPLQDLGNLEPRTKYRTSVCQTMAYEIIDMITHNIPSATDLKLRYPEKSGFLYDVDTYLLEQSRRVKDNIQVGMNEISRWISHQYATPSTGRVKGVLPADELEPYVETVVERNGGLPCDRPASH